MDAHFDIFQVEENSNPQKIAFARSLDEARKQVQELGASQPGRYLILSSLTGHVISVNEPSRAQIQHMKTTTFSI
jgi:hypothetical protein